MAASSFGERFVYRRMHGLSEEAARKSCSSRWRLSVSAGHPRPLTTVLALSRRATDLLQLDGDATCRRAPPGRASRRRSGRCGTAAPPG